MAQRSPRPTTTNISDAGARTEASWSVYEFYDNSSGNSYVGIAPYFLDDRRIREVLKERFIVVETFPRFQEALRFLEGYCRALDRPEARVIRGELVFPASIAALGS